ncbi:hypothetical protein [Nocardioides sp.]|uniref:hypothetical protein n=1 Tax=Nocardioides sp. TaxID=35761 RepID=UPI0026249AF4|nr:hypothetical protein [Nocardioides sp.]
MSSTVMIILVIAVILAACFLLAWYVEAHRANRHTDHSRHVREVPSAPHAVHHGKHVEHDETVDTERLHSDEEQFSDMSIDPRTRMR